MRRPLRRAFGLGLLLLLPVLAAFLGGLVLFAEGLPRSAALPERATDALVVLTGGSGRLSQGVSLLAAGKARKLFVSGVNPGLEVEELLRTLEPAPEALTCCVVLGYDADDTWGNARETAAWMEREGFHSLRLVTAVYHMPRSLVYFRRALPEAEILTHPVYPEGFHLEDWWRWPGSASLLASEYVKYLLALARGLLPGPDQGEGP